MNERRFPEAEKGEPVEGRELERINQLAGRADLLDSDGMSSDLGVAGPQFQRDRIDGFWARITGQYSPADYALYSFKEMQSNGAAPGITPLLEVIPSETGFRGGPDIGWPAKEVNSRSDVPFGEETGAVVWMRREEGYTFFFEYVPPATQEVGEVDGSPLLTGITRLLFDQADGFVVTQPAAGQARIDLTPVLTGSATVYKDDCVAGVTKRYSSTISVIAGVLTQSAWSFDSNQGCCVCPGTPSAPTHIAYETDVRCVPYPDGNSYNEVRERAIYEAYDPSTGVLYTFPGPWFLSHLAGCCDCPEDCPPDPSVCVPGECELCADPPYEWKIVATSFTGACEAFNQTWLLANTGSCQWSDSITVAGVICTATMLLDGGGYTLTFQYGPAGSLAEAVYAADSPVDGECCQTVLFEPTSCTCDDTPSESACNVCIGQTPTTWTATLAGFTDFWSGLNGDRTMTQESPCQWNLDDGSKNFFVTVGGGVINLTLTPDGGGFPGKYLLYQADFSGDCCSPVELPLTQIHDPGFGDAPAFVVLSPSCTPPPDDAECPDALAAEPACCGGSEPVGCCEGVTIPETLYLTFTDPTGDALCLDGETVELTKIGLIWDSGALAICDGAAVTVECVDDQFHVILDFTVGAFPCSAAASTDATDCEPLLLVWTDVPLTGCTGQITMIVTETPP